MTSARWRTAMGFAVAFLTYVALGLAFKALVLNWIVGPLYPLIALHLVPSAARRIGGGRR